MLKISYRLKFLKKITNDSRSFRKLTWSLIFYSMAVRIKLVKTLLLSKDQPYMVNIHLFEKDLKLKLRNQDIPILLEIFQEEAYSIPMKPPSQSNVMDLGAHIGLTSLYFYLKYDIQGKFLLVEPSLANYNLLEQNTKIIKNRSLKNIAISHESGNVHFAKGNHFGHNHHVGERGESTPCLSIDDLIRAEKIDNCYLLKMDIEGEEERILLKSDTSNWVSAVDFVVLEMHMNDLEFEKILVQKGFDFQRLDSKMYLLNKNPVNQRSSLCI